MKVSDILEYEVVDHIEKSKVELVRHVKQRDYVITSDDAASGAGCTLLQIFQKCKSHEEAAAMEIAIRNIVYKLRCKQGDVYPRWWTKLASKFGVTKAEDILLAGVTSYSIGRAALRQCGPPAAQCNQPVRYNHRRNMANGAMQLGRRTLGRHGLATHACRHACRRVRRH